MAGKYADRFRSQQPTGAAGADVVDLGQVELSTGIGPDLDQDRAARLEPTGLEPWHRSAIARLALVVAVIVGVVGGAYGWGQWQAHEADVATRSAVDLVASAMTLDYSVDGEVSVGLTYQNDGAYKIIVRDAWFESEHLKPAGGPPVLEIAPGGHKAHFFTMGVVCPSRGVAIEPPPLHVRVETVDGVIRDRVLENGFLGLQVVDWVTNTCASLGYEPTDFAETYADFTYVAASDDGLMVHTEVTLGFGVGVQMRVDSVEPMTPAFSIDYAIGDPSAGSSFGAEPIILIDFRVADCAMALVATERDMMLIISGAIDGNAVGQTTTYPSSQLAIALTRLTDRACPS